MKSLLFLTFETTFKIISHLERNQSKSNSKLKSIINIII